MDSFVSLKKPTQYEFTEKRSVFIADTMPVFTEKEAADFVSSVRKKHPDARHVVYAYSLENLDPPEHKFSDDGEPQGTAGLPVLNILTKQNITCVAITVTRYFGGILLGAPGLLRAYTSAASEAVRAGEKETHTLCKNISVRLSYTDYGKVDRLAKSLGAVASPPVFTDTVLAEYCVRNDDSDSFVRNISDLLGGFADVSRSDPFYRVI